MKQISALALAALVMLFVCELDCFAQRGGRGGGGRGGSRGGMSRGGARSRPAPSRPSRSPSMSRPSRTPSRSRPSMPSRPSPSTRPSARPSRPSQPGKTLDFSNRRPSTSRPSTRPSTRPGSGSSNPGLRPGSGTRPGGIPGTSRPGSKPGSGNPGLRPGTGTRPGGTPGTRPGTKPGGGKPGLTPGGNRPGGNRPGTGPGNGNRPGTGKPGLKPGGGKPGKPGAGRPPGNRPPGNRPPGNRPPGNRPGYGNRPYYPPGYWHGYRPGYRYRPYYHYYRYGYRPWAWATFGGVAAWIGYSAVTTPVVYNYTVSDGYVYNDGVQVAPVEEYEAQANQIAESVPPPDEADEWMSVGVFAILPEGVEEVDVTVQLAVGKNGAVAGTYYKKEGDITLPLQGAIDEKNQRVAWKVGEEDAITMETGLDSLTKDQSKVIIYFSEGVSETWNMQRIDQETAKLAQQEIQNDSMKNELVSAYTELEKTLDDSWKSYLALPESVYSTTAVPTQAELEAVIKRYQQIQTDSKYQALTKKPEFQTTYKLLNDYLKDLQQQPDVPAPPAATS
ncbi:hypothetical protein [Gimesia aquarii]|uniref:Uncharacterized protein n=1 Tax=Gimesia aquarii TaxID=2527964 RepID=A0A517VUB1_9PLAN|nr:hypothetical protein [Gimesia aquarii]QDT96603.1 hypothetical protein V144x_20610 [Gimesia aquarii]